MRTGQLSQPAAPTYGGTGWEAAAGTPQRRGYLVKSVTGAQLLPSGKQKRGMACRRRSSSSFWPLRRFSRWNKVMPRVRVMPKAPGLCWGQGGTFWPQHPWVRPKQKVPAHPWASSSPKSQFQPVLPRGYRGTVQAPNTLQRGWSPCATSLRGDFAAGAPRELQEPGLGSPCWGAGSTHGLLHLGTVSRAGTTGREGRREGRKGGVTAAPVPHIGVCTSRARGAFLFSCSGSSGGGRSNVPSSS